MRIPTPFHVGDVNIYVVGDTLIDTGPKTPEALEVLRGVDLDSLRTIVITHGHVDHHGLAYYMKKMTACTVFVHRDDVQAVSDYTDTLMGKLEKYREFLLKSGISRGFISGFEHLYGSYKDFGDNCEVEPLDSTLETEKGVLKVIHTPGHTPGSCCFLLGDVLYSGDTLLPHISTNASLHAIFDERCGLNPFLQSLRMLAQVEVDHVFPGHGKVIDDHRRRIHTLFEECMRRKEKVICCLSGEFQTLVEITNRVFGVVPVSEIILALAECYDHLRILEGEGIVECSEEDAYLFRL
jgi:glyoxylase-like metal-dependent hydrolase (beta-lactamase superfamily II)